MYAQLISWFASTNFAANPDWTATGYWCWGLTAAALLVWASIWILWAVRWFRHETSEQAIREYERGWNMRSRAESALMPRIDEILEKLEGWENQPSPTTEQLAATFAPPEPPAVKPATGCVDPSRERPAWFVVVRQPSLLGPLGKWRKSGQYTNVNIANGTIVDSRRYFHRREDARAEAAKIKRERGIR